MLPKVISVQPKPNYVLEVVFENDEIRSFSVEPFLQYTVYKPLQDVHFFNEVAVKYGTVVWGEEELIDFDPYTIYTDGEIIKH
ncbi:MAG: DUF2442 domain-containing protein [Flavobacterium sp.]|nr:DUF2442 domain-containing protein [Flavobacterium sp.]